MPYLKPPQRHEMDNGYPPRNAGELNYLLSHQVERYWKANGESYQLYNDILGALEGAKLELYRTLIGPYETSKALINGALGNQTDLAWAAGFVDGEGNFNYTPQRGKNGPLRSKKGRVQISVSQKEPLLLLRLKEAVGGVGYIRHPYRNDVCWSWTVTRFDDILHVVTVLWPHLGPVKRKQALVPLQKWENERDLDLGLPADPEGEWPA